MVIGCTGITREVGNYKGLGDFFHPLGRVGPARWVEPKAKPNATNRLAAEEDACLFCSAFRSCPMSAIARQVVEATLRQFTDPNLNQDQVTAGCLRDVSIDGSTVRVRLELGYAADLFKNGWAQML